MTSEAAALFSDVRERAGLSRYAVGDFAGVQDFLDKILLERGHELWFEGCRRSDLIRHGKYVEKAKEKGSVTAADHFNIMPLPSSAITNGIDRPPASGIIHQYHAGNRDAAQYIKRQ